MTKGIKMESNMEWVQFVIFFLGVFGLFIWNRAEARSDARHMDAQVKSNRDLIFEVHRETASLIQGIRDDMKDFHGKLERQDAEFRGIMAKQDAEFKAHLMYSHDKKN